MLFDRHDSIDINVFLSEYWQKKPLLIKRALPHFTDFLSPEELAGLACEEEVESRLVFSNNNSWQLKQGPFSERDFTFLPEHDWTLLVQSVDHWLPEIKRLLQEVSFIPSWRLDDVMISYAVANGSVGPHFDYYDVFLVQGQGIRQWQIGETCDSSSPVNTDSGLKILENFSVQHSEELHPGDILYIPAGLSHWGTAIEPGLCYSIGFRAPDVTELLSAVSLQAEETLSADSRYRDTDIDPQQQPGNISSSALQQVKTLMHDALANPDLLIHSFGRLMTEPRLAELFDPPEQEITPEKMAVMLQKGRQLMPHPATRFACHHHAGALYFFVNGESLFIPHVSDKLAALNDELQSAQGRALDLRKFQRNEDCLKFLCALYNQGSLVTE